MLIQLLFYGVVPIFLVSFFWAKRKLNSLQSQGIKCIKPSFPWGNLNSVGKTVHISERMQEIYETFKATEKVSGFYMMLKPTILLNDLDVIKQVMVKDFNKFVNRGTYYHKEADPVSAHMFALEDDEWKFIRSKLSPTFSTNKIKQMFSTIVSKVDALMNVIDTGMQSEARNLCNRYVCDVIGSVTFGLDIGALKDENCELLKIAERIFRPSNLDFFRFFFCNSFINLSRKLRIRLFPAELSNYFVQTMRDAVEYREKNNIHRPDFLNSLMQLMKGGTIDDEKIENDKKLTFDQIIADAFLFFFAGFETSSTAMSFALLELAANPDIQEKTRREIQDVLSKHNGEFTYESIFEMSYLNQVFNETLRKYSNVGIVMRIASEDFHVADTSIVIKRGTQVIVPVNAIHNDEDIYANSSKFDPDRFSPEQIASRHNFSFIPFGEGLRSCIGMRFAQIQVKYAIAKLLTEYDLSLNSKTTLPVKLINSSISMAIEGGIWIDFKKKNY